MSHEMVERTDCLGPNESRTRGCVEGLAGLGLVAGHGRWNDVERHAGEVQNRVGPTRVAPVDERQQFAALLAQDVHRVQVAVREHGVHRANRLTGLATCDLDVARRSRVETSSSDKRREKPIHIRLLARNVEIAPGIRTDRDAAMDPRHFPADGTPGAETRFAREGDSAERGTMDTFPQREGPVHAGARVIERYHPWREYPRRVCGGSGHGFPSTR